MSKFQAAIVMGLLLLAGAAPSTKPATYYGKVLDPSGKPVSSARVFLLGGDPQQNQSTLAATTTTDSTGSFQISAADSKGWVLIQSSVNALLQIQIDYSTADEPAEIELPLTTELPVRFV